MPATFHAKVSVRLIRPWAEVQADARETSEALGLSLDRAFRLVLALDRGEVEVLQ